MDIVIRDQQDLRRVCIRIGEKLQIEAKLPNQIHYNRNVYKFFDKLELRTRYFNVQECPEKSFGHTQMNQKIVLYFFPHKCYEFSYSAAAIDFLLDYQLILSLFF